MRKTFDQELQNLQDRLLALGSQVGENVVRSVATLTERDEITARRLIEGDAEVNRKRIEIMSDALTLIARQQPMAGDMRLIASVLEITGELERINDYAKGIARNSLLIGAVPVPDVIGDMPDMARKTRSMLQRSLEAHALRDAELARTIPAGDDEIDALFNKIYQQILSYVAGNPGAYELVNYLVWTLHNLERAADRVTNICEWVVYNVTGQYVEMDSEFEAPPAGQ